MFVDLLSAYDTVKYKIRHLIEVIRSILSNRRFNVEFQRKRNHQRNHKNGLLQDNVLSTCPFNIYPNDQPIEPTRSFIYADEVAISYQSQSIEEIESNMTETLSRLNDYYKTNQLQPNLTKTETCLFHLNNRQASRELQIIGK